MAKSKFFRAFVEGQTVSDGRKVEAAWIDQIVGNFNVATAPVRINCEHIKGFSPEPPFNGYGDVIAVRAQTDTIKIGGKDEQRRALYCQVEANDQLVTIRKAGQKPYPSVEISPNFAGTGKVGLVGLAVTDNPALLGVEALSFSALKPVYDGRKTAPEDLFSAIELAEPIDLEPEPSDAAGLAATVATAVAGVFSRLGFKPAGDTDKPGSPPASQTPPAAPPAPANDNAALFTAMSEAMSTGIAAATAPIAAQVATLSAGLSSLTDRLEKAEAPGFSRQPATGGSGDAKFATDC